MEKEEKIVCLLELFYQEHRIQKKNTFGLLGMILQWVNENYNKSQENSMLIEVKKY